MFKDKNGNKLTLNQAASKIIGRFKAIFLDIELMVLRWVGHCPFHCCRRFFYRLAGMKIGKGSTLHMWANFF